MMQKNRRAIASGNLMTLSHAMLNKEGASVMDFASTSMTAVKM
jgi:hypothetical protein